MREGGGGRVGLATRSRLRAQSVTVAKVAIKPCLPSLDPSPCLPGTNGGQFISSGQPRPLVIICETTNTDYLSPRGGSSRVR